MLLAMILAIMLAMIVTRIAARQGVFGNMFSHASYEPLRREMLAARAIPSYTITNHSHTKTAIHSHTQSYVKARCFALGSVVSCSGASYGGVSYRVERHWHAPVQSRYNYNYVKSVRHALLTGKYPQTPCAAW